MVFYNGEILYNSNKYPSTMFMHFILKIDRVETYSFNRSFKY